MPARQSLTHAVESTNLADLLERILDKGVVVAGDISIKLVDIELLKIELRLVICSVDKARELGLDWWNHQLPRAEEKRAIASIEERLGRIEERWAARVAAHEPAGSESP
jgi:Gas vesicle protein